LMQWICGIYILGNTNELLAFNNASENILSFAKKYIYTARIFLKYSLASESK
jgi:hypothetical protein